MKDRAGGPGDGRYERFSKQIRIIAGPHSGSRSRGRFPHEYDSAGGTKCSAESGKDGGTKKAATRWRGGEGEGVVRGT